MTPGVNHSNAVYKDNYMCLSNDIRIDSSLAFVDNIITFARYHIHRYYANDMITYFSIDK